MGRSTHRNRRARIVEKRIGAPGAVPGALVVPPGAPRTEVHALSYSRESHSESKLADVTAIQPLLERWPVTWINVDGFGDLDTLKRIGELFHLHPLALEDVVHVHQRPKVEPYPNYLFIVLRMPYAGDHLTTEQLSMFLGRNFLVTFQDLPGDCFDAVRDRIRHAYGRLRNAGPDYLAYNIIDAVVDNFFPLVERYGDQIEALDELAIAQPLEISVRTIHDVRHDLLVLRRIVAPLRDAIGVLRSDSSGLLTDETKLYLRDCYDHATHLNETVQSYQEMSAWHMEAALSSLNFRSGEIMRVLTLIATIFIPLSFIAGVYGMNFVYDTSPLNMPELRWYYGYPFALFLMAATAGSLLLYFHRKGWL